MNGKMLALALSGNTLYVGGKFGLLRLSGRDDEDQAEGVGKIDATTGVGSPAGGRSSPTTVRPAR